MRTANIAAIAAAVFTLLDSTSRTESNGASSGSDATGGEAATSNWKRAARTEGLM